jgi:hypothetical protein
MRREEYLTAVKIGSEQLEHTLQPPAQAAQENGTSLFLLCVELCKSASTPAKQHPPRIAEQLTTAVLLP